MAMTTLSLVTLAQEYRGDVRRNINRRSALLRMLKVVPGEGKNIAWVPEFDGAFAESYSEGADVTTYGQDAQKPAILTWGLYRANINVTNLAMDASASSSSPDGNHQLWARHLVNSSAKLTSTLNSECWVGDGSGTRMIGLSTAVDSTGTYATIDPAVDTLWKSYEYSTAEAITMAGIRADLAAIYVQSGDTPDMAGCDPIVFNKVGALFDNTRRQIESVNGGQGPVKLDAGFRAVECDGTVFFRDKDAPADSIFYLNSDEVEIQYLPSASQEKLIEAAGGEVAADDGFGSALAKAYKYEMLAKTGPAEKAEVLFTGSLVVKRRNAHGKRTSIA